MAHQDGIAMNTLGADNYENVPKSVFAMLAYSLAQRLTEDGDRDAVMALLADEWAVLHMHGIVPQKPKRFMGLREEAEHLAMLVSKQSGFLRESAQRRLDAINAQLAA